MSVGPPPPAGDPLPSTWRERGHQPRNVNDAILRELHNPVAWIKYEPSVRNERINARMDELDAAGRLAHEPEAPPVGKGAPSDWRRGYDRMAQIDQTLNHRLNAALAVAVAFLKTCAVASYGWSRKSARNTSIGLVAMALVSTVFVLIVASGLHGRSNESLSAASSGGIADPLDPTLGTGGRMTGDEEVAIAECLRYGVARTRFSSARRFSSGRSSTASSAGSGVHRR